MRRLAGLAICLTAGLTVGVAAGPAWAVVSAPVSVAAQVARTSDPAQLSADWSVQRLPAGWRALQPGATLEGSWYRIVFDLPNQAPGAPAWALYLPDLFDGGQMWLNGAPLVNVAQTDARVHIRWERPALFVLPAGQMRVGPNELLLRSTRAGEHVVHRLHRLLMGTHDELLPRYDQRLFWTRTVPQATVAACIVVGLFVGFIWWRRRSEVLYGLFGLAVVLWGVRTLTFVIEVLPADWWPWWRLLYHAATGGFITTLALFAMRFAGHRWRRVELALIAYWALGPLAMLLSGGRLDGTLSLLWTAGLIPVGLSIVWFTGRAALRQRSPAAITLSAAVVLAVAAGIHDYLVAFDGTVPMPALVRLWTSQRVFLLHHAANALLLVMMSILTLRFVQVLDETSDLNRHLEERVAERERELKVRHAELARLERDHAVDEERQRIMQDLHDGLGSQMFTALLRVERGGISTDQMAQVLRDGIADMRLTFEVIAPGESDLRTALGNFRFRWDQQLREAGLQTEWVVDGLDDLAEPTPATVLQIFRIAQEALTNVLKHAGASRVRLLWQAEAGTLVMSVSDDGQGLPAGSHDAAGRGAAGSGRGLSNMQQRAKRLGALLRIEPLAPGTRVVLRLPAAGRT